MGMNHCTQLCGSKLNENEIIRDALKISSEIITVKDKTIILIQSFYRGYKSRLKYKKNLLKTKQKQIIINNSNIYFKENWEYFFKFKQQYNFSFQGIKSLYSDIINYYKKFFKAELNSNTISSQSKTIRSTNQRLTFKRESVSTIKEINDDKITIYTKEIVQNITNRYDFMYIFKYFFLSLLYEKFEIGNENENNKNEKIKFEFCTIKANKSIEIEILYNKAIKEDLPKEKLIENKEPYLKSIIENMDNYEKNECNIISFMDSNDIYYFGSIRNNSLIKWGLGKEYFIEINGVQSERFKYCGYFQKGLYHGLGMHVKEKHECYYGEFRNGYRHGFGILETEEYTYKGFFYKDKFEGYGKYHKQGIYYSGSFHEGLFEGFGYMEIENKSTCVGCFCKGKINGEACYIWNNGNMYYGSWVDGKMHGYGEYNWKNGDKYFGYYENDLKHGKGEYYFKNGSLLKGNWINGKKEGKFIFEVFQNDDSLNMKKGIYSMIYKMDIRVK